MVLDILDVITLFSEQMNASDVSSGCYQEDLARTP